MKAPLMNPQLTKHLASLVALAGALLAGCKPEPSAPPGPTAPPPAAPGAGIVNPPAGPGTFDILAELHRRGEQQRELLKSSSAFTGFKLTDRIQESGITFEHVVVDDAGRDWVAGHYDHGNGVAVADVDGDGKLDLYFVTQLGSNRLYRNLGGGKFEDITETAGVGLADRIGVTASFGDIDNDGDPDLFVTTVRMGNALFENLGGGRFKDITAEAGVQYVGHSSGIVFFDFNRDGLLDVFVANVGTYTWPDKRGRGGFFLTVDDAFLGHMHPDRTERSILYQNLGNKKFRDVSAEVNLVDTSWSGDATIGDVNDDGWPDLYVVNMQGDDHLYVNLGGKRFEERSAQYFPRTPWGAMCAKFFDVNQDGLLDLYITDMHSDMTDKQTADGKEDIGLKFEKAKSEKYCTVEWSEEILQGSSNNVFGNALYLGRAQPPFSEVSDPFNVETFWPWGFSAGDLNADGFEDIFVTAGMGHPFRYGLNSLLLNDGGKRFVDAEFALGVEPRPNGRIEKDYFTLDCSGADRNHELCQGRSGPLTLVGSISTRSSAFVDLDDDGDLDLVTNEFHDRPQLLMSDLTERRKISYLKVKLTGRTSNRDATGALVKVHAGGRVFTQLNDGKTGYLTQSVVPLYFGLGEAAKAERVEIRWPNGRQQTVTDGIPANGLLNVTEPAN
jgi:enediyne biosynthesis protein E4